MKFYYYSFNEYRKLDEKIKSDFLFLSTAYTTPSYWNGQEFTPFVPTEDLFLDACQDFEKSNFEERYKNQIYSLNRNEILNQLKNLSQDKDIVFLVWEAENKNSERDIFISWLTNTSLSDLKFFSFSKRCLKQNDIIYNL